jgi:hypothetical protein
MDFIIVVLILNLPYRVLPKRRKHIPVLTLQPGRHILKSGIELCRRRDIPALGDGTTGAEVSAGVSGVVGKRRGNRRTARGLLGVALRGATREGDCVHDWRGAETKTWMGVLLGGWECLLGERMAVCMSGGGVGQPRCTINTLMGEPGEGFI